MLIKKAIEKMKKEIESTFQKVKNIVNSYLQETPYIIDERGKEEIEDILSVAWQELIKLLLFQIDLTKEIIEAEEEKIQQQRKDFEKIVKKMSEFSLN